MVSTIIETSKILVLDLGEHVTRPVFTEEGKLFEICAPFAFKLVHSARKVKDLVTGKVTMCTEAEDYVWFYECLEDRPVQGGGKKASTIRSQDPENIRYYPDMTHRPIRLRFNEIKIEKTLGVLYSNDYKVSAKMKLFEVCSNICIDREIYRGYEDWIKMFADQGLEDDIFRLAHNIRGLKVDFKLPNSTDIIVDPTQGWLYDSKRKDHMLCYPGSGKPVLNENDDFIWACDLNKRKSKPIRTASAPVNGSISAPKVPQKKPEGKDSDDRQSERRHREIKTPSQDSSKDKLPSQRSSEERVSSKGDSKARPPTQGSSRDKLSSQSGSKNILSKRSDSSDKLSGKSKPKVVPSKQSNSKEKLPKGSDTRNSSDKKLPDGKTASGSGSNTKRPVTGRSQTFASCQKLFK